MTYENPREAFQQAIDSGRLTENESSEWFAEKWMYMFTDDGGFAQFKNIETRQYLVS
tara:strand:- start:153 stop:323 length:171 start_codon:yes stop_codon:yes gene_type:complete